MVNEGNETIVPFYEDYEHDSVQRYEIGDFVRYIASVSRSNPKELQYNHLGRIRKVRKNAVVQIEYNIEWLGDVPEPWRDYIYVSCELRIADDLTDEELSMWSLRIMKQ